LVHPRLAVSALSSYNFTFDDDLSLWDDLDVRKVGLYLPKLEAAGMDSAVERVRAAGLSVSTIACRGFVLHQPETWATQLPALEAAVDVAAALDADCLFVTAGTPGSLGWDECVDALRRSLEPLMARAAVAGVPIAVEHTNPMRREVGFIHTLRDMVEVARELDIGVVVEITNCFFERSVEQTLADGVDTFRVVQISDYLVGTLTASERAVPGDGDIPLARLIGVLEGAGYRGSYELEMLGPRIEDEGYRPAIARALIAVEAMLPAANAAT
jgi:sugar phosphate isomerase/epimerase